MLVRFNDGDIQIVPVLCDRWSCKLCGPKRAAWLKREVQRARFRYKLNQFWTLTIDTKSCTAAQSFRLVKAAWHRLYTHLREQHGSFRYLWVMETTKRGYAHLHLLIDLAMSPAELSRRWKRASRGSYIVDAESVNSERASDYLTKYCMEQATVEGRPPRARFFGRSRDVAFDPFRPEVDTAVPWYHWRMPYKDAVVYLGELGPMKAESLAGTPYAAVRSRDGLDIEAICAAISAQVIDQAAEDAAYWAEPSGDDLIEVEA